MADARAAVHGFIVPTQRRSAPARGVTPETGLRTIGAVVAWLVLGALAVTWVALLVAVAWWVLS